VVQIHGRKVYERGLRFNDTSGERLRQWLDLTRKEFYDLCPAAIVPMRFCFPITGKAGDLPHPSPCNNRWLKSNPWFEVELLPVLRARVQDALKT
jgi:uracil-DNA glycosylase